MYVCMCVCMYVVIDTKRQDTLVSFVGWTKNTITHRFNCNECESFSCCGNFEDLNVRDLNTKSHI